MKLLVVALAVAAMTALLSPTANAGSKELTEYVRKLLDTGELPQTADDAAIEIVDDGHRMKLTGQQLKAAVAEQQRVITNYKLKEFKVDNVDCGQQTCSISYDFRTSEKVGNAEISQNVHSEEEYRVTGNGFVLIRASQVQKKEGEL